MAQKQKGGLGFTIVELAVVFGIISIISIIIIPLFVNYQKNTKLKTEARLLATNLRLAQQLAITEQIIYQVKIEKLANRYEIVNSQTGLTYKTVNLNSEVSIDSVTDLDNDTAQFNATGGALQSGTIVLKNTRNATVNVLIKPSGYVQITE